MRPFSWEVSNPIKVVFMLPGDFSVFMLLLVGDVRLFWALAVSNWEG